MRTLLQDLSYGLRMLRKSPGLTGIILIMLTLGIGATTAVFTVFDAILLRPLAYEKPEQLVQLWSTRTEGPFQQFEFSYPDYLDVKKENKVFSQIGGYSGNSVTLSGKDGAEQLQVAVATSGFFETLGVRPILGRTFEAGEDEVQKNAPVLLSYGAWQRRFGGNPGVIGTALVVDGELATIVGVLPKNFVFASHAVGGIVDVAAGRRIYPAPEWLLVASRGPPQTGCQSATGASGDTDFGAAAIHAVSGLECRLEHGVGGPATADRRPGAAGPDRVDGMRSDSYCLSPARTSLDYCWRERCLGGRKSLFGWLWVHGRIALPGSCSLKVCCWRSSGARRVFSPPTGQCRRLFQCFHRHILLSTPALTGTDSEC